MSKKFKSAAAAAAFLAEDPKVEDRVNDEIKHSKVVSSLLQMRVDKGLTQEQIAKAMGCDDSVISRIESGNDRQLKWADIAGYCHALKIGMTVVFSDHSLPAAERIRQCVFKIHQDLEHLARLAKEAGAEDKIAIEINRFYREVLFNFLVGFQKNHGMLPVVKLPAQSTPNDEAEEPTETECGVGK